MNERFQVYNNKPAILIQNKKNEWYSDYVQEKNYFANIFSCLKEFYSLELRDIDKIILKLSIIMSYFPEDNYLCLPFLIDLIILNTYYPNIYNSIKLKTPVDNYNSDPKMDKLRLETFSIIKIMNSENELDSNIYRLRMDLKNYFNLVDFAQDFD